MPGSSRFGGQVDASGVLADLFSEERRRRESMTQQAVGRAREEQNALDKDAQERWQNGQMSDGEWLAYVRSRVTATVDWPEEHTQWESILRESSEMISDNQAEFAYQSGGSIHQLIAYYQRKMGGINPTSQTGMQTQKRLHDLQDKALGDEIAQGVDSIQDRINIGQASPADLLGYLRGQLGRTRGNSSMRDQLQQDIDQVEDQVVELEGQRAVEGLQNRWQTGQITGTQYAAELRALSGRYVNSPSTYYSMLAEADAAETQYGGLAYDGSSSGGGGGGGGSRGGSGGGSGSRHGGPLTLGDLQDEWDDRINRAVNIGQQVIAGETVVTDPGTGEKVNIMTDAGRMWLRNVDQDAITSFNSARRVGLEMGDSDMISSASEGLDEYLSDIAQPKNVMADRELVGTLTGSISRQLDDLANESDPYRAAKRLDKLAGRVARFRAARERAVIVRESGPSGKVASSTENPLQTEQAFTDEYLSELEALELVLNAQTPEEVESALDQAAVLVGQNHQTDIITLDWLKIVANGTGTDDGWDGIGATRYAPIAVANGEAVYFADPGGKPRLVGLSEQVGQQVDEEGNVTLGTTVTPDVEGIEDMEMVTVAQQIGGKVVRVLTPLVTVPSNIRAWAATARHTLDNGQVIQAGQILSDEDIAGMGAEFEELKAAGKVSIGQYNGLQGVILADAKGRPQTWTRLPGGSWVMGAYPMRLQPGHDGAHSIDSNGQPVGTPTAVEPVPVPFIGVSGKLMEEAMGSGLFDAEIAQVTNVNWQNLSSTGEPADWTGAYWGPEDETKQRNLNASYNAGSGKEDRRGESWWAEERRTEKARAKHNALVRVARDKVLNVQGEDQTGSAFDQAAEFGKGLGLKFGGQRMLDVQGEQQQTQSPASWPRPEMPELPSPPQTPYGPKLLTNIRRPLSLPHPEASSGPSFARSVLPEKTPTATPAARDTSFLSRNLQVQGEIQAPVKPPPKKKPPAPTPDRQAPIGNRGNQAV